jgi:hypothetical protein
VPPPEPRPPSPLREPTDTDARERDLARLLAAWRTALADGHRPPAPPAIDMTPLARELRRAWWRAGAPGHYPTCPCGKCDHPPPSTVRLQSWTVGEHTRSQPGP